MAPNPYFLESNVLSLCPLFIRKKILGGGCGGEDLWTLGRLFGILRELYE